MTSVFQTYNYLISFSLVYENVACDSIGCGSSQTLTCIRSLVTSYKFELLPKVTYS